MYHLTGSLKTRSFRAVWMLEELGVPYELTQAQPRSAELAEVDTGGKVPVLSTKDGTIWDSTAIMTYLTDAHGQFTHPAGSFARARQDAVTHQILDEIDAVLWTAARHSFILPPDRRVGEVKDSLRWEFARNVTRLAERMEGPYLAGDSPTVPDFLLVHCLNWATSAKFAWEATELSTLYDLMVARPAYLKVTQMRG